MTRLRAFILAGGLGQRMGTLCQARPKPVLPFACSFSIIDFTLSNCVHSGISDVAVLVDHQRQAMSDYVSEWSRIHSHGFNIEVLPPANGSYSGTADAIYQNIGSLLVDPPKTTLILAGDHVYRMNYGNMLAFHERVGADVTIGVVSVPLKQAHRFGIVKVDDSERIIDFVEKPQKPTSNLASMGIYLFNTQFLIDHLLKDSGNHNSNHDFGRTVIPAIVKGHRVFAYRFREYWQDIGTIEAYFGANMELIRKLPSISLNGNWPILTRDLEVRPPMLINNSNVTNSLIGESCTIEGQIDNSIVFPDVTVRRHATVRNSILMSHSAIDSYTTVDHSILDEDVRLGKFCYVGFGAGFSQKQKGITVVGRGTTIQDYSAVSCKDKTSVKLRENVPLVEANAKLD